MKIAIVTGASSGMGREFVLQLSRYVQVDEIWAIARRSAPLEALKTETPVPVRPISLDLCQSASFDTLAQLLEAEKPDVKLLVLSGYDQFEYAVQALRLGVSDYLLKPLDVDKLLED